MDFTSAARVAQLASKLRLAPPGLRSKPAVAFRTVGEANLASVRRDSHAVFANCRVPWFAASLIHGTDLRRSQRIAATCPATLPAALDTA